MSHQTSADVAPAFRAIDVTVEEYPKEPQLNLDFRADAIMIIMDAGEELEWSYNNGCDLGGIMYCEDRSLVFDGFDVNKIWFKKPAGKEDVKLRIFAWLKQR